MRISAQCPQKGEPRLGLKLWIEFKFWDRRCKGVLKLGIGIGKYRRAILIVACVGSPRIQEWMSQIGSRSPRQLGSKAAKRRADKQEGSRQAGGEQKGY